jgi:putative flavoprotein involved in K+ transport
MDTSNEHIETVVIGGGQAGLSVGYHLARRGRPFVILDEHERVGDNWRANWDTLRLYSPASHDGLPGMPFPAERWAYPTKDEMADYLAAYAEKFDLPVRRGTRVHELAPGPRGYVLSTDRGRIECENVVVATGTFGQDPYVPDFADQLDPRIRQLHSADYRNPDQLGPGKVLVVGASHSGADIAYEVAEHRPTVLAGTIRGEIPFRIEGSVAHVVMPLMFVAASHLLTIRTPLGRKARPAVRDHGGPLIRVKRDDLRARGVEMVGVKVVGVEDGRPVLDGGQVVDADTVIWCTGFRQRLDWIRLPILAEDGWPEETRGVTAHPGLYFMGLAFQFGFTSMLLGGVGRDAEYVVEHLDARAGTPAGTAVG